MKKRALLVICTFGCVVLVSAQSEIKVETPKKQEPAYQAVSHKETKVTQKWVYNYVINDKKLRTLFVTGKIPADFPKYNHNLSHKENKIVAAKWALKPENHALLTEEGKEILNKAVEKYNTNN